VRALSDRQRVRVSKPSARRAASTRPYRSVRGAIVRSTVATVIRRAFLPESKLPAAVAWGGNAVAYIDQRLLPFEVRVCEARNADEIAGAISTLAVRGAPCIGIFAAYGVALLRTTIVDDQRFQEAAARVRAARPTAVNLAWAVDRVLASKDMLAEAQAIHREEEAVDAAIARNGLDLIPQDARVITHCNTGPLATGAGGTALGIILAAQRAGRQPRVFINETRPLLQGSRLTEWELRGSGVDAVLQVDSAAAVAMAREGIDLVLVGADRVVRNGDTANKIGTYALAVLASHHGIPFYVAAPRSSFDFAIGAGADIPIEMRGAREVTSFGDAPVARQDTNVFNPAFDVTPRHLITAFVTEYGIVRPPYHDTIEVLRLSR
jgi:methylthioribose-1-phosphate isomerase